MGNSDNNSTQENKNRDVKQSRSSLIVKMPPHARMKSRLGVRVKHPSVKRSKNIFQKPRYYDSVESDNEEAMPNDDAPIDENAFEENEIAEIISILERARARSCGTKDNEETRPESSPNSTRMHHQKKIPEKYY